MVPGSLSNTSLEPLTLEGSSPQLKSLSTYRFSQNLSEPPLDECPHSGALLQCGLLRSRKKRIGNIYSYLHLAACITEYVEMLRRCPCVKRRSQELVGHSSAESERNTEHEEEDGRQGKTGAKCSSVPVLREQLASEFILELCAGLECGVSLLAHRVEIECVPGDLGFCERGLRALQFLLRVAYVQFLALCLLE